MLHYHQHHAKGATGNFDTEEVHNFYEAPVIDRVAKLSPDARIDPDFHADVCCVALNHLPPRYIRHSVDMRFFLSPDEANEMDEKIESAVLHAIEFVTSRRRDN